MDTDEGMVGSGVPFWSLGSHMPGVVLFAALHQSPDAQSVSTKQPLTQSPLDVSQMVPVWPVQSALVVHLPHAPAIEPLRKQNGCPVGHESVDWLPLSPLQATQACALPSQMGVWPEHCDESVHPTQVPELVSQCGVDPEHCASMVQPTHVPAVEPVVEQLPERHTLSPFDAVQGPSPLA
jgi:hypothetical protein